MDINTTEWTYNATTSSYTPLQAAELLHEWVHHDANHLRQILANVQAFTWPQMGNAQRFSEGETASP